jgi:lipopolysaccharide/colanic/teichoic acid biosynthesis glycosyltransferase
MLSQQGGENSPREESSVTLLRVDDVSVTADTLFDSVPAEDRVVLDEESFKRMIALERKRTERSKEPFLLMLIEAGSQQRQRPEPKASALDQIVLAMLLTTRETDLVGWHKGRSKVGVMFTGLVGHNKAVLLSTILGRVSIALRDRLTSDQFSKITLSFHFFPDEWDDDSVPPSNPVLYPDVHHATDRKRSLLICKRAMDIAGTSILLALCAPLLAVIAIAVKLSSEGPILFRQSRVGQYGQRFTFLKFRSMRVGNDSSEHQEYVTKLIAGVAERVPSRAGDRGVYKLANDTRVTRIGKFLRQTSLDELPQLFNVIKGEMSLVGPRPPIPYELAAYQTWHRRRLLQAKPGITGLWQVAGRSKVKFDDMVRLDLRYAASWSPWLDLKILLRTPAAVIKGAH